MPANTEGSSALRAVASAGLVDHTSVDAVVDSGRHAIGPVGRNLWYAVVDGPWKKFPDACDRVATTPCVSYAQP